LIIYDKFYYYFRISSYTGELALKEKINQKRTASEIRKDTDDKIKVQLIQAPMRWSDLLRLTGISPRTLKKGLDRMVEQGEVIRTQEDHHGYPPPVFYGLSEKARKDIAPFVYGRGIPLYLNNLKQVIDIPTKREDGSVQLLAYFEVRNPEKTIGDMLDGLIKRAGIAWVYSMLMTFESENPEWVEQALSNFYSPQWFAINLGLFKEIKTEEKRAHIDHLGDKVYLTIPNIESAKIDLIQLKQILEVMQQKYSDDINELEKPLNSD